ncbi:unnamed protein product [Symbiodinium sp. CCMP2592]|nr:unnamed protein product [Symbiodinium sp. CCMP2592]
MSIASFSQLKATYLQVIERTLELGDPSDFASGSLIFERWRAALQRRLRALQEKNPTKYGAPGTTAHLHYQAPGHEDVLGAVKDIVDIAAAQKGFEILNRVEVAPALMIMDLDAEAAGGFPEVPEAEEGSATASEEEKELMPLFGAPAPDKPRRKRSKVAAGFPAIAPGTPGFRSGVPGTPGPGTPGFPAIAPGTPGFRSGVPGTPGLQMPRTPGVPLPLSPGAPGLISPSTPGLAPGTPGSSLALLPPLLSPPQKAPAVDSIKEEDEFRGAFEDAQVIVASTGRGDTQPDEAVETAPMIHEGVLSGSEGESELNSDLDDDEEEEANARRAKMSNLLMDLFIASRFAIATKKSWEKTLTPDRCAPNLAEDERPGCRGFGCTGMSSKSWLSLRDEGCVLPGDTCCRNDLNQQVSYMLEEDFIWAESDWLDPQELFTVPTQQTWKFQSTAKVMSICLAAFALMACWQFVAPVFVQPKTNRGLEAAAPAAMGALVSMASSLPAEATVPAKGPLYGTELCTKPLIYIIYPLCEPVFLVCPLYNFPIVLGFFAALVTVINLILPETQPDEDLRVTGNMLADWRSNLISSQCNWLQRTFDLHLFSPRVKSSIMARRGRSLVMSICLAAVALMACWQFVAPVFVQPKTNRGLEAAAPAAMGALVSMASSLPAEATVPAKGPLYGTELCTKPLIYIIYPLCEPVFLVCPLYNFPIVLGFFAALVTVINLILPETQPDEDLRVG